MPDGHAVIAAAPASGPLWQQAAHRQCADCLRRLPEGRLRPAFRGSHTEHAVALFDGDGALDRGIERGGEGQSQHTPCIGRIDDAVVP